MDPHSWLLWPESVTPSSVSGIFLSTPTEELGRGHTCVRVAICLPVSQLSSHFPRARLSDSCRTNLRSWRTLLSPGGLVRRWPGCALTAARVPGPCGSPPLLHGPEHLGSAEAASGPPELSSCLSGRAPPEGPGHSRLQRPRRVSGRVWGSSPQSLSPGCREHRCVCHCSRWGVQSRLL